jgi:microcystin degradation protein MlrC
VNVFSDAADATASGASGDSNAILRAAMARDGAGFSGGRLLLPIVDAAAVTTAVAAGVGASGLTLSLGGSCDPARFTPLECTAVSVIGLYDGRFTYENGTSGFCGR